MFDLGWSELLVIGITALIILGPRDLTKMFRELGRFTGKARRMPSENRRLGLLWRMPRTRQG